MTQPNRVPVVYLAGGMRSNWQDKVIEKVGATDLPRFFGPRIT